MEEINFKNFGLVFASIFWCSILVDAFASIYERMLEYFFISFLTTTIIALISRWCKKQDRAISWMIIFYCLLAFTKRFMIEGGISGYTSLLVYLQGIDSLSKLVAVLNPVLLLFFIPLLFTLELDILPYEEISIKSCVVVLILCIVLSLLL